MTPDIPFADVLWPNAAPDRSTRGGTPYLPVVRGGAVRSLLPAASPRVLARSLGRSNGPETLRRHLLRQTVSAGIGVRSRIRADRWSGLVRTPDDDLRDRVGQLVGQEVQLAIHFGPPRANRKPVLQALDRDGRLVAVVKVAINDLTDGLVSSEAAALDMLVGGGRPALEVPRSIAFTTWQGRSMLVQSALDLAGRHVVPTPAARAAAEVSVSGLAPAGPPLLAYVRGLEIRLAGLADPAPVDDYLAALSRVLDRVDLDRVGTGPWHGDWSPQNVASGVHAVAAWDWERFATNRPQGFDTAHFRLQQLLAGPASTQSGVSLLDEAPTLLSHWHRRDKPEQARGVILLLLLELAARYLADGQTGTGSPGSHAIAWIAPALESYKSSGEL